MKKRLVCIFLILAFMLSLCACGKSSDALKQSATKIKKKNVKANVYVLSGPTGIGAVNLWDKSENKKSKGNYKFTLCSENTEIVAAISKGKADIAAVATNLAATLYNKTEGDVTMLAVNTLGVLSMLSKSNDIISVEQLRGKTIYLPGQGANPEYILKYILSCNGINPDSDVNLQFVGEGSELLNVWQNDSEAVIMAPQPVATSILMQNKDAKKIFDMTEEWEKASGKNSRLMMGCVIVRTGFLEKNKKYVKEFIREYEQSVDEAINHPNETGKLCEKYQIVPKAVIATKAIPDCGLVCITGSDMANGLKGYYEVMLNANPESIGGMIPEKDFYYDTYL